MDKSNTSLYPVVSFNNFMLPYKFNDNISKNHLDCRLENSFEDRRSVDENCEKFISIRGNSFIPFCCGLYYFEIKVTSDTGLGDIGLGYSWESNISERKLGFNNSSLGLYLMNGQSVSMSYSTNKNNISIGDRLKVHTLGIGINFLDISIFCTVNGVLVHKLSDFTGKDVVLSKDVYPVISCRCPKAKFSVNLGVKNNQPFSFDFEFYKATQLRKKRDQCLSQEYSPKLAFVTVQNVVSDYLLHHGYAEAWEKLHKYDDSPSKGQSLETIRSRRFVQKCIIDEQYLLAIDTIEKHFPDFFTQFPIYKFILKCRHFIKLITSDSSSIKLSSTESAETLKDQPQFKKREDNNNISNDPVKNENEDNSNDNDMSVDEDGNLMKSAKSARLDPDLQFKLPEPQQTNGNNTNSNQIEDARMDDTVNSIHNGNSDTLNIGGEETMDTENNCHDTAAQINKNAALVLDSSKELTHDYVLYIIKYGKTLKEEALAFSKDSCEHNVEHQKGLDLLTTAFSLIAYKDPYSSPFKDVLRTCEREQLAHKINGTINGMLGRTTRAQLDCLLESIMTSTGYCDLSLTSSKIQSNNNEPWMPILAAIHPKLIAAELRIEAQ